MPIEDSLHAKSIGGGLQRGHVAVLEGLDSQMPLRGLEQPFEQGVRSAQVEDGHRAWLATGRHGRGFLGKLRRYARVV